MAANNRKSQIQEGQSKVASMHDFRRRRDVKARYEEFRKVIAPLGKNISDVRSFIGLNNLSEMKSNDIAGASLSELCQRELDSMLEDIHNMRKQLEIVESEATVLSFKKAS